MDIIPAIDLLNGDCVRLYQGNYDEVTKFNADPIDQALIWESMGAARIHLVDLDGAKSGQGANYELISSIANQINIPIQLGGGIRSFDYAKKLIDNGIDRLILGTIALENPTLLKKLTKEFPNRIIVGIDAKNGYVATRGWLEESKILATDLCQELSELELASIIYTDISKDGTLKGPNIAELKLIALSSKIPIIASGGIGSLDDLIALTPLENIGIEAVIVGRALYDGSIDLKEAIKTIKNLDITDYDQYKTEKFC